MSYRCNGEIPVLEGSRLRLRRMERSDAQQMLMYWGDPEVVRYMNISAFQSEDEVWEMINLLNGLAETEDAMRWGIEHKESGMLIGSCGFNMWQLSGAYRAEIGYEIGARYWGQGYMSEALRLLFTFGYQEMGLNRIEALVYPDNEASIRLLSHLGFQSEGLLREYQKFGDQFVDLQMFSLLKREFLQGGTLLEQE